MSDASPQRYAVTVAYDGRDFQGWQVQPGARTVQLELEKALAKICPGHAFRIHGSGRTDRGVHARGQVFHFDDPGRGFAVEKWREALNGVLPEDIRVRSLRGVSPEFHARFSALGKQYRYFIWHGEILPPELRFTRYALRLPLELSRMQAAAAGLQGEHDFRSFSASRGVDDEGETVRHLRRLELQQDGPELCLIAEADGFLYKMVRQLAGALLRVGRGELDPEDLQRLLDHPERNHTAPTAPAQALFLWKVDYPE